MLNLLSVVWVEPQDVGEALIGLAVAVVVCLVLSAVIRTEMDDPNPTLLSLAGMAAIAFVTLGLTSL